MVYIIRSGEFELQKRLILEAKTNKKEEHQIEEEVQQGLYSNLEGVFKLKQSENTQSNLFKPSHRLHSLENHQKDCKRV